MAELAHAVETEKEHRHDGAHEEAGDEKEGGGKSGGLKLQADGRASDAAIRRMLDSDNEATGAGEGAAAPSVGDAGMLTKQVKVTLADGAMKAPQGTYVVVQEVLKRKRLKVKLYSQFGGKEATISGSAFRAEPALAHKTEPGQTDQPQDHVYQEYTSILWDGAPKAADVAQGRLADCYLNAAMGAVAAANPKAIMSLFSPHTPNLKSYTVTLHADDGTGKLVKHPVVVDTALPTRLDEIQMQSPTYTLKGKSFAKQDVPIWPALLEKAYAQMMGGFDVIGDKGGYSDAAMEALTGVQRSYESKPSTPDGALQKFKQFQKDGRAVVCGTLGSKSAKSQGGFTSGGDGYRATLMSDQGLPASIVPGSLRVYDKAGKAKPARDDSNGKMSGMGASGSVAYRQGTVDMKYEKDAGPEKPENLQADYDWRGQLDTAINLYAWHAYIFESVTPDGMLQFKNPWGTQHPNPMKPADFLRLFSGINVNNVPKEAH